MKKLKILHTSDWHLGRRLYGRKRYDEFSAFLEWLLSTIDREQIDVLLIAGDVFDTRMPSNFAQELYYDFLRRILASFCRHVVVIAGNHDSPSFLNASKSLLGAFDVYVVGVVTDDLADEVIVLYDAEKQPEAIVCAVPYLRDKDIRTVEPGETMQDKNQKLVDGVKNHYAQVCEIARQKQAEFKKIGSLDVPIIGMGHLFTAGGKTVDGDGVRNLYVGSLVHVQKSIFSSCMDYLALGHLHVPQCVGGIEHIRYSGSPIPMGYGEATQDKKIVIIELEQTKPFIREIRIPCFQDLERLVGSFDEICTRIKQLKQNKSSAWLEIEYTGHQIIANLWDLLEQEIADSSLEIRRIKNKHILDAVMMEVEEGETLDDIDVHEVFARFLKKHEILSDEQDELIGAYNEIIHELYEEDKNVD